MHRYVFVVKRDKLQVYKGGLVTCSEPRRVGSGSIRVDPIRMKNLRRLVPHALS